MDKDATRYRILWGRLDSTYRAADMLLRKLLDMDSSNEDVFAARDTLREVHRNWLAAKVVLSAHYPNTMLATYPWNAHDSTNPPPR